MLARALLAFVVVSASFLVDSVVAVAAPASDHLKKEDDRRRNRGVVKVDEDRNVEGQVVFVNREVDPPEVGLANVDGTLVIRVVKTDEVDIWVPREGDYIRANGEKLHELLFEANELEVIRRWDAGEPADDEGEDEPRVKGRKKRP
jgi:hypothetical protein